MLSRNRLVTGDTKDIGAKSISEANARLETTGTGVRWAVGNGHQKLDVIPAADFSSEKYGGPAYEDGGNPAFSPEQRKFERFIEALSAGKLEQKHIDSVPPRWRRIADCQNLLRLHDDGVYRYWQRNFPMPSAA